MAQAAINLLHNDSELLTMRMKAYQFARSMFWPSVGRMYLKAFQESVVPTSPRRIDAVREAGSTFESQRLTETVQGWV